MASHAVAERYYAEFSPVRKGGDVGTKRNMSAVPFNDLLRLVEQGDLNADQALDQMVRQLGVGLAILVTGLAPAVLLVIGEVTRAWARVGPIVEATFKQRSFTHANTRVLPAAPETWPRLSGAIALIAQRHLPSLNASRLTLVAHYCHTPTARVRHPAH
jgi:predicted NBD/HSP70 family sugar kinase